MLTDGESLSAAAADQATAETEETGSGAGILGRLAGTLIPGQGDLVLTGIGATEAQAGKPLL